MDDLATTVAPCGLVCGLCKNATPEKGSCVGCKLAAAIRNVRFGHVVRNVSLKAVGNAQSSRVARGISASPTKSGVASLSAQSNAPSDTAQQPT